MRKLLFLVLMGLSLVGKGMMMSPDYGASYTGFPILNKNVHVVKNTLTFKPDDKFISGLFLLESDFEVLGDSVNIPFLFYDFDWGNGPKFHPNNEMKIWIDGKLLSNLTVAQYEHKMDTLLWTNFNLKIGPNALKYRAILFEPYSKYFEELLLVDTLLKKGFHKLKVEYIGTSAAEYGSWLINRSFEFNLDYFSKENNSSFIFNLDSSSCSKNISFNLIGIPLSTVGAVRSWNFRFPSELKLSINYKPELGIISRFFAALYPNIILVIILSLLVYLHIKLIVKYRRNNFHKRFSIVNWLGSWLVPIFAVIFYVLYAEFVDFLIGEDAAGHHAAVLIIVFYPLVMPFYWLVITAIDLRYRDQFSASKQ